MIHNCPDHGDCEHKYHSNGKGRPKTLVCVPCCRAKGKLRRRRNITDYTLARTTILKFKAIRHKGGACQKCGYDRCLSALEFHHRDPEQKEFAWAKMRMKSWERIKSEIEKCDLLCANCHRETHWDPTAAVQHVDYIKNRKTEFMGDRELQDYSDLYDMIDRFLTPPRAPADGQSGA